MDEMRFEVAKSIQAKLKDRINASIFVCFDGDALEVKIRKNDIVWNTRFYEAIHKAVTNVNFEENIVEQIVADYKKFVTKLYFY